MVYGVERAAQVEQHQGADVVGVGCTDEVVVDRGCDGLRRMEATVGGLSLGQQLVAFYVSTCCENRAATTRSTSFDTNVRFDIGR